MSEINEMITIEEMITIVVGGGKRDPTCRKFVTLGDILRNMESRLKKMEQLEKEVVESRERSLEMKGKIIDTLCEKMGKMEDFQAKASENHFMVSSNIDTLFRANVDRNKEYQKLTEKYNREFAECNKDILGTHMTLMNYKRENEMLDNRISVLYTENQSRDNGIDTLRLKLIDVLDEVEKNTSEAAEIKRMAFDIYGKNKEHDRNFGAAMSRMDELERAMKTVTVHWSDICSMKERIDVLEKTCDSSQN